MLLGSEHTELVYAFQKNVRDVNIDRYEYNMTINNVYLLRPNQFNYIIWVDGYNHFQFTKNLCHRQKEGDNSKPQKENTSVCFSSMKPYYKPFQLDHTFVALLDSVSLRISTAHST